MSTRHLLLWTLGATLVAAALYLLPNFGHAIGDAYIMRKAHLTPLNDTWEYWWQVFSKPNHGPQYRPVGFFAYFWVMGKLFDNSFASLAIASYLFFAWSLAELLLLCRRLGWGYLSLVGITLVMVLHPVTSNILDQSFAMKYQFTLAVLIHGLRLMVEKEVPLYRWLILFGLSILAGLSQEGTVVFPFVWLLWDIAWHRRLRWQHAFYFSLVVAYFAARVFVFRLPPRSGFMQVSWEYLPTGLSYYLNVIFSPFIGSYGWLSIDASFKTAVWLVAPVMVLILSLWSLRRSQWIPLFCLMAACALVAPYAVLVNHIGYDRAYWGLLPAGLLIGWCLQKGDRRSLVMLGVCTLALIYSFSKQKAWCDSYLESMKTIDLKTRELLAHIKPKKGETIAIFFDAKEETHNDWINYTLVTGAMSHIFPADTTFHISLKRYESLDSSSILIANGIRFYLVYASRFRYINGKRNTLFILGDQFQVRHFQPANFNWDREFEFPVFFPNERHP